MKILKEFARYAVGALFIFSGIIKVNDPVGTAIKLEEYFQVFAADIAPFFEWFVPAALFLSVFLSVLEVVLGVALIVGYRMRITSWILLAMIIFFTFLTFYSAYFNKVTDCGCFGDAIKLTPWESFYKDIILLVLIGVIFWKKDSYKPMLGPMLQEVKIIGTTLVMLILAIYAIAHLPFIDFRAYKVGNHLPTLMKNSEPLKYVYVMEKDGETIEFENYPSGGGYEYKEARLMNPEAAAKITDLNVWQNDDDYTDELLTGTKLVIIIHQIEKTSLDEIDRLRNLTFDNPRFDTWILTSSGYEKFEAFRHQNQLAAPYFFADATVLKTMVRSNPGVLLLKDGTVLAKWHYNDTPLTDDVIEILNRQ
ncbi:DoxX protein [Ekhidna lutea]|uniref:DoxX protein n=1 Tax=Ekhidna lutea TaxID=447679 RepID=A0A239IU20_EKHLU|nr:BT_3928 family protein [Ekhidna lutea]SNS97069.1 DoxX protein [Ekhidna lutea]